MRPQISSKTTKRPRKNGKYGIPIIKFRRLPRKPYLTETDIRVTASALRKHEPIGPSVVLGTGVALIFGALTVYLVLLGGAWAGAAALSALVSLLGLVGFIHSVTAHSS